MPTRGRGVTLSSSSCHHCCNFAQSCNSNLGQALNHSNKCPTNLMHVSKYCNHNCVIRNKHVHSKQISDKYDPCFQVLFSISHFFFLLTWKRCLSKQYSCHMGRISENLSWVKDLLRMLQENTRERCRIFSIYLSTFIIKEKE